jgi:hypothetical protein
MHAFDVLGDLVRRRILELLAADELASGAVVEVIAGKFGITQAAIPAPEGAARLGLCDPSAPRGRGGSMRSTPLRCARSMPGSAISAGFWTHRMLALGTEIARGRAQRKRSLNRAGRNLRAVAAIAP